MLAVKFATQLKALIRAQSLYNEISFQIKNSTINRQVYRFTVISTSFYLGRATLFLLALINDRLDWIAWDPTLSYLATSYHLDVYTLFVLILMMIYMLVMLSVYYGRAHRAHIWTIIHELVNNNVDDFFNANQVFLEHAAKEFTLSACLQRPCRQFCLLADHVANLWSVGTFGGFQVVHFKHSIQSFPIQFKGIRTRLVIFWLISEAIQLVSYFVVAVIIVLLRLVTEHERAALDSVSFWVLQVDTCLFIVVTLLDIRCASVMMFNYMIIIYTCRTILDSITLRMYRLRQKIVRPTPGAHMWLIYRILEQSQRMHALVVARMMKLCDAVISFHISIFFYTTLPFNLILIIDFLLSRFDYIEQVITLGSMFMAHLLATLVNALAFERVCSSIHRIAPLFSAFQVSNILGSRLARQIAWANYYETMDNTTRLGVRIIGFGTITKPSVGQFLIIYCLQILVFIRFFRYGNI